MKEQDNINIMPMLSNNSHELFHSNLWKWLIENDHNFVKVFFKKFKVKKFKEVQREKKNIDLCIEDTDGNKYIIENKFKSIPDEVQLKKYKNTIDKNGKDNKYLLTHLIDCNFQIKGWDSIEYGELIKRIERQIKKDNYIKSIRKYKSILYEYCDYVKNIIEKVNSDEYVNSNYYCLKKVIPKEILEDEMKAIYMKLKCEKLRKYIDKDSKIKNLVQKYKNKDYELKSLSGYHRGKTTLTYRVQLKRVDAQSKHPAIELQIEGRQYRYMVRIINKDDKFTGKDAFKIMKGTKFFNEEYDKKNNNQIHGNKSSMKEKYCKYKSDKNRTLAIYQYYNLKDKTHYSELRKNIYEDLDKIYKLLKNKRIVRFLNQ